MADTIASTRNPPTMSPRTSAPNNATPIAAPPWRIAFSKPDADPARARGTADSSAAVIGAIARPQPNRLMTCAGNIDQ
jgi:hypothetical protein